MPEGATELLDRPAGEVTDTALHPIPAADAEPVEVVAADLLVEEISIDGMCGVY